MLTWTITYRTAGDEDDPVPLLDALAGLAHDEGAVITVTDSHGVVVLDVAPDDEQTGAWQEGA